MEETFEQWYKRVDRAVLQRAGLWVDDLPDCPFRDWFDDGFTPDEAAEMALKEAGFPDE